MCLSLVQVTCVETDALQSSIDNAFMMVEVSIVVPRSWWNRPYLSDVLVYLATKVFRKDNFRWDISQ